jgi:hypothetical protein
VALGYDLALTGGAGLVIIDGPFARNPFFLDMMAAATDQPVLSSASQTGTAIGAAVLFAPESGQMTALGLPHPVNPALTADAAGGGPCADASASLQIRCKFTPWPLAFSAEGQNAGISADCGGGR